MTTNREISTSETWPSWQETTVHQPILVAVTSKIALIPSPKKSFVLFLKIKSTRYHQTLSDAAPEHITLPLTITAVSTTFADLIEDLM